MILLLRRKTAKAGILLQLLLLLAGRQLHVLAQPVAAMRPGAIEMELGSLGRLRAARGAAAVVGGRIIARGTGWRRTLPRRGRRRSSLALPSGRKGQRWNCATQQHRRQRDGLGQNHDGLTYSVDDCPSRASNSENRSAFLSRYCRSLTALPGAPVRTTPSLVASVLGSSTHVPYLQQSRAHGN